MRPALAGLLLASCAIEAGVRDAEPRADAEAASLPSCYRVVDARAPGGEPIELGVRDGRLADVDCAATLDAGGRYLVPALVDSHVHLAYFPVSDELARGGVAAAVDLAAPLASFERAVAPLRLVRAGPMIAAPGGYPTTSWGRGGYGLECGGPAACAGEVDRVLDRVLDRGARVIKVSLGAGPDHDDATLLAIVERAHARGARVAAHALDDASAARAAAAGCDVLAHAPTRPLTDATILAWSERAVISTLGAFGSDAAIDNVRRLRAAGATVLYGTDLGNSRTVGIDAAELARLAEAGLDPPAILASATSAPAAYWDLPELGALTPGRAASFLLLDEDPHADAVHLARPALVILDGRRR